MQDPAHCDIVIRLQYLLICQRPGLQIVCTLGPKSRSVEILEDLLRAGMSVARFNFSHGSHDYHQVYTSACVATRCS